MSYFLVQDLSRLGDVFLIFGGLIIIIFLIALVFWIICIVGKWKLFEKAGKNGWAAIIPFYSDWVYVEIAGVNWWWYLLVIASYVMNILSGISNHFDSFVSMANLAKLIALFVCNYNISKKLHKDIIFAVLMTIFPFIVVPLIGFSSNYEWDDSVTVSDNGPFDNDSSNKNVEYRYCTNCGYKIKINDKYCTNCGKKI